MISGAAAAGLRRPSRARRGTRASMAASWSHSSMRASAWCTVSASSLIGRHVHVGRELFEDAIGPTSAQPCRLMSMAQHETSLLDVIARGDLDDHLAALAAAIEARRRLLYTVGPSLFLDFAQLARSGARMAITNRADGHATAATDAGARPARRRFRPRGVGMPPRPVVTTTASSRSSPICSRSHLRCATSLSLGTGRSLTSIATTRPSPRSTIRSISRSPAKVRRCPTLASAACAYTRTDWVTSDSNSAPRKVPSRGSAMPGSSPASSRPLSSPSSVVASAGSAR